MELYDTAGHETIQYSRLWNFTGRSKLWNYTAQQAMELYDTAGYETIRHSRL